LVRKLRVQLTEARAALQISEASNAAEGEGGGAAGGGEGGGGGGRGGGGGGGGGGKSGSFKSRGGDGGTAAGAGASKPWGAKNEELERMRKDLTELRSAMEEAQDDLVSGAEELAAAAAARDGAMNEVHTELSVLQAERMKLTMQARTTSTRLDALADDDEQSPNPKTGGGGNEGELRLRLFEMEKQARLDIDGRVGTFHHIIL
jgi:hypothetical protein